MEFTSKLSGIEIDILGLPEGIESAVATVNWNFEIEARKWGIKGLSAFPTSVTGTVNFEEYDEATDNYKPECEIEFNSEDEGWKLEHDDWATDRTLSDSILPENVEVDFKGKTITVNF